LRWSAALLLFVLPPLSAEAGSHKSEAWASSHLEAADKARETFDKRPEKDRSRRDYQRLISSYRRVYYGSPASSQASTAVLSVAYDGRPACHYCGACGNVCPTGKQCMLGKCETKCATGITNCSGACVDTKSSAGNCGACGVACTGGAICSNSVCACPAGYLRCPSGSPGQAATDSEGRVRLAVLDRSSRWQHACRHS